MKNEMAFSLKKTSLSKAAIILVLLCSVWFQFSVKKWRWDAVIQWDVKSYYSYIPATFIYNDLTFEFIDNNPELYGERFWPAKTPDGKYVEKMTMGMAVMYGPFFAVAHLLAKPLGYPADGFSRPYQFFLSIGALFYLLLGLIFLRKLLLRFFKEPAAAITLVLITLGTNLWYYSTLEPGMSHTYSFALFAIFLYVLDRWLERAKVSHAVVLGIVCGLISLVRPTNALVGVFFLFWNVSNIKEIKERVFLLVGRWKTLLIMLSIAITIWIPQLLYWKIQTGQFFYNSYGEEGFFFNSPRIIEGLFSFRKGWFIYTPIMLVASAGFFILRKFAKGAFIAIVIFMMINVYVIFSWWSWWYGGSFGARPMIESFVFMAFPLAAVVQWAFSRKSIIKISVFFVLSAFTILSVFQTFQYYYGAIHWDSMTREAYFKSFGKLKPFPGLEDYWRAPDYEKALKGIYVYAPREPKPTQLSAETELVFNCNMETLDPSGQFFLSDDGMILLEGGSQQTIERSRSGNYSVLINSKSPFALANRIEVRSGDKFIIEIWFHDKAPREAVLVASAPNPDFFYQASNHVSATDEKWNLIKKTITIPAEYPDSVLLVYIWNPSNKNAFFDDFYVRRVVE
jgi:hypothetical protein